MSTPTTNFGFKKWQMSDTVSDATSDLNDNWDLLDGFPKITGIGYDAVSGFNYMTFRKDYDSVNNVYDDYIMLWGNFGYASSSYNCSVAVAAGGPYKSITQPTDPGMVTQAFPAASPLSSVEAAFIVGGGDPDGTKSTAGYPHYETTAVQYDYTESGGYKTGVRFYWVCPKQETSGTWAKIANIFIIGRL